MLTDSLIECPAGSTKENFGMSASLGSAITTQVLRTVAPPLCTTSLAPPFYSYCHSSLCSWLRFFTLSHSECSCSDETPCQSASGVVLHPIFPSTLLYCHFWSSSFLFPVLAQGRLPVFAQVLYHLRPRAQRESLHWCLLFGLMFLHTRDNSKKRKGLCLH